MDQVDQYQPPPNPAKVTDSRSSAYIAQYGDESWELDALEPAVLTDLIHNAVAQYRDDDAWNDAVERENEARRALAAVAENLNGSRKEE